MSVQNEDERLEASRKTPWLSCDGHVVETPEVMKEMGMEYVGGGQEMVGFEEKWFGQLPWMVNWSSVAGADLRKKFDGQAVKMGDVPGAWQASQRRTVQVAEGVAGEVLYPTWAQVAVELCADRFEIRKIADAYNEWVGSEFVGKEGMFPLALLGGEETQAYLTRRNTEPGLIGVLAGFRPELMPNERAFAEAAAHGVPIHWHAFHDPRKGQGWSALERRWAGIYQIQAKLLELIEGGVFFRHPKLKVVFAEADVGWLPHLGWRAQTNWDRWLRMGLVREPVYIWKALRENVAFVTNSVDDMRMGLGGVPLANLMWGWDWPQLDRTEGPRELLGKKNAFKGLRDQKMLEQSQATVKRWYPQVAKQVKG